MKTSGMYGFADAVAVEIRLRQIEEESKKGQPMTDQEYVKNAVKTENTDFDGILSRAQSIRMLRATHAVFGLQTEAAEITDLFKKHIFYGKPLDENKVYEEIGDLAWYIALLCDTMGFDLEKLKASNIAKLQARYPNKFSSQDALKRDEGKEKSALESQK